MAAQKMAWVRWHRAVPACRSLGCGDCQTPGSCKTASAVKLAAVSSVAPAISVMPSAGCKVLGSSVTFIFRGCLV